PRIPEWAREESDLSSAAYHAAALPLCYAPVGTRDRTCTCNTPGLSRRPLLIGIPWRVSDPDENRTRLIGGRQPPRFPDAYRARCLPGEIRTPCAAFGGLRPIHLAGRRRACVAPGAGFEPAVGRLTAVCVATSPP